MTESREAMNAAAPVASVIVLNYNGLAYLDECLASLEAQTFQAFELIMVDNASTDGSVSYLEARADRFRLILNDTNLGFAEGNNVGIREARGRYVVFLNNDTRVDPRWLAELVGAAEARPESGMFASQVRSYDHPETMDTSGIIVYRDGMSRGMGRLEPAARYAEPCEVLAPSACAALYRKAVLDAIGGFDADFFAYCEDLDLGMRARLAGWTGWYVPTAVVYHRYSGTGGKYSSFKAFLVERNHLFVLIKLFPKRLILMSPLYTGWRYALQAYGVLAGKGASGQFAKEGSALRLVPVLLRAYWETFKALPSLLAKRRAIARLTRAERREVLSWFDRFGISARELALKD